MFGGVSSKYFLFIAATIVSGGLAWLSVFNLLYLRSAPTLGPSQLILPTTAFFIFTLASAFFVLVSSNGRVVGGVFGLIAIGILFLFGLTYLERIAIILAGILLIATFLIVLAWRGLKGEREGRIRFGLTRLLRRFLPTFFTAHFILIGFLIFYSPAILRTFQDIIIPRFLFDIALKPLEPLIKSQVSSFRFDMPIDEFLTTISLLQSFSSGDEILGSGTPFSPSPEFLKQIKKEGLDKGNLDVRTLLKNRALTDLLAKEAQKQSQTMAPQDIEKMHRDFGKTFGVVIISDETAGDVVYDIATTQLNRFNREYKNALPFSIAVGLFFTLKTLSFIFMWPVILAALGIFNFLRRINIFGLTEEEIKKETLVLH